MHTHAHARKRTHARTHAHAHAHAYAHAHAHVHARTTLSATSLIGFFFGMMSPFFKVTAQSIAASLVGTALGILVSQITGFETIPVLAAFIPLSAVRDLFNLAFIPLSAVRDLFNFIERTLLEGLNHWADGVKVLSSIPSLFLLDVVTYSFVHFLNLSIVIHAIPIQHVSSTKGNHLCQLQSQLGCGHEKHQFAKG